MNTDIVPAPAQPVVITPEQIDLVRRTVAKDATPDELALYFYDCNRYGVHPLDKLLHFSKRQGKYVPLTSIDLLRSRASDTGELAGISDPVFRGEPMKPGFEATCTVWRFVQGVRCPFEATARWPEYYPGDNLGFMWRKMPYLMLGKCAEGLALRKGFPRQLSGLYAREELDQADAPVPDRRQVDKVTGEIVSTPPPAPAQPPAADGKLADAQAEYKAKWGRYRELAGTLNEKAKGVPFSDSPGLDEIRNAIGVIQARIDDAEMRITSMQQPEPEAAP